MTTGLTRAVSSRDHVEGPADAPVTLVEYGDFECPHCGRAYPVVQAVQQRLGRKLRFVFRHFPLRESHTHAEHAAEAAETAGAHGEFWAMHDMLFEHQDRLDDDALAEYAGRIGLDPDEVAEHLASGAHESRVREDFMDGVRSGVNGTPTFFINGTRFDGDWSTADTFVQALQDPAGTQHGEPRSQT